MTSSQRLSPAIVVAAYNRPNSLRRLLRSLAQGRFDQSVELVQFFRYMVDQDLFFVYPRTSLTTNFGDPGVYHGTWANFLQRPLLEPRQFRYVALSDSIAVYDAFLEIRPDRLVRLAPHLSGKSFAVDLYGKKPRQILDKPQVLTARDCIREEVTFGRELKPIELNVRLEVEGDAISLTDTECCSAAPKLCTESDISYFYDLPAALLKRTGWIKKVASLRVAFPRRPSRRTA